MSIPKGIKLLLLIFIEHATVMDHKYKALLQNIPTRHVITAIAKPADRPQQITKLRSLDINNFFILGSLQSIRDVLGGCLASLILCSSDMVSTSNEIVFDLITNRCIER